MGGLLIQLARRDPVPVGGGVMFVRATGFGSWSCSPVIMLTLREARNLPIYNVAVV
jgi:hypothetical protein